MSPPQPLSLTLRPLKSPGRIFLHSQFRTKPKRVTLSPSTSLAGKTVLITGGSTGIGLHAARHFLSLDLSRLILAVRNPTKGAKAASELKAAFPKAAIEIWDLEMTDYDSVTAFAARVAREFDNTTDTATGVDGKKKNNKKRLDIAILNAGMTGAGRNEHTGHNQMVQVNFLSTYLLAILLLPILRDRAGIHPGRLTIVGSGGVYNAKMANRTARPFLKSFADMVKQPTDAMEVYFSSKALGMLFLVRLFEYLPLAEQLVVNMVDPGYCKGTELQREATGVFGAVLALSKTLTGRSAEDGAWTYVDAAVVQGKESHGCFVMDWEIRPFYYAVYEPEGPELMDTLFKETMEELDFAGVRGILEGLKSS